MERLQKKKQEALERRKEMERERRKAVRAAYARLKEAKRKSVAILAVVRTRLLDRNTASVNDNSSKNNSDNDNSNNDEGDGSGSSCDAAADNDYNDDDDDDYDNDSNIGDNDYDTERRSLRLFNRLLAAPRTVSNPYPQVSTAQSCSSHVQYVGRRSRATCRAPRGTREGSAIKFDRVEIAFHI